MNEGEANGEHLELSKRDPADFNPSPDPALERVLGCLGYYGFGSGYALAKFGPADDTRQLYCGRCSAREECWTRHKARMRVCLPGLIVVSDQVYAEGFRGREYFEEFAKRTRQDLKSFCEPFTTGMQANIYAGGEVAQKGRLEEHAGGPFRLSWPLEAAAEVTR